jgi:hypothetical protein
VPAPPAVILFGLGAAAVFGRRKFARNGKDGQRKAA